MDKQEIKTIAIEAFNRTGRGPAQAATVHESEIYANQAYVRIDDGVDNYNVTVDTETGEVESISIAGIWP